MSGVGSPFIACVPTKISQNWFKDDQRIIATTILGLSNPVGLVFGQLLTPIFVQVKAYFVQPIFTNQLYQPDKAKLWLTGRIRSFNLFFASTGCSFVRVTNITHSKLQK
jgi:hypothetical protein